MAEEIKARYDEDTPSRISKRDIKILDNLFQRTENLPDILHLRAAEIGYSFTEQDKTLLLDTYARLDDILKEVAAFINIRFPGCERHVKAWNDIDFDAKVGPFKVETNDRELIKREWRKGIFDLKSLIKCIRNEAVLLLDDEVNTFNGNSLNDISSNNKLEHYTNEKNIPNQELVNATIEFFNGGIGAETFSPIGFLNLLDKQNQFLKLNHKNGDLVIQHLKNLPLTERQKHMLYGFILKWSGGYPVANMDEEYNATLKLVQKEFLNYGENTPEKELCRADQAMRNKFEKYSIALTAAVNNTDLDLGELLEAMGLDGEKKKGFDNFGSLFQHAIDTGLIEPLYDHKLKLISQSVQNYEFNVWLQTHKDWEYRNEEQYKILLTTEVFAEFLAYKTPNASLVQLTTSSPIAGHLKRTGSKRSIRQIALICHYTDRPVTRTNAKTIVAEYQHTSGDALFNHYTYYRSKANRLGTEDTKKKNDNKIQLFQAVLDYLCDDEIARGKIAADLKILKVAIAQID